jgi:protein gp37
MGKETGIQWCDSTFNPHRGCTRASKGCSSCYAETMSRRNPAVLGVWGPAGTRVVASEAKWREPAAWDRAAARSGVPHRVFCASLADVFEAWDGPMVDSQGRVLYHTSAATWWVSEPTPHGPIPMQFVRERLFSLIAATPHLTWQLLTKRPENIRPMLAEIGLDAPPANAWMGTSVEDQEQAGKRIPHLLAVPATARFLSCEPLLEDLDLTPWLSPDRLPRSIREAEAWGDGVPVASGIHQIIAGGESGPKARPFDLDWARSLVEQCRAGGVAAFVKQAGSHPVEGGRRLALRDPHGGDPSEWPADLRVREFPAIPEASLA